MEAKEEDRREKILGEGKDVVLTLPIDNVCYIQVNTRHDTPEQVPEEGGEHGHHKQPAYTKPREQVPTSSHTLVLGDGPILCWCPRN